MDISRQLSTLEVLGKIEGYKNDIERQMSMLAAAPLWRPGSWLLKQSEAVLKQMNDLKSRFGKKLVITLLGPCGSGKSTLLNALAGADDLSKAGNARPTTTGVVVFSREMDDADQFVENLGYGDVKKVTSPSAAALRHVMLIDTPDIDSTEAKNHIPIVKQSIALSDVLVCLFDAENPKRRDYVDFLSDYIGGFTGDSLIVALNKCDRQDETELKQVIVPELSEFIENAWDKPITRLFCISARNHLRRPGWVHGAQPRHDFDQFSELQDMVFSTLNRAGSLVDRRLSNARDLRDFNLEQIQSAARNDVEPLINAKEKILETESKAVDAALESMRHGADQQLAGTHVLLYQKLAQRWVGPMGWLIAVWARMLVLGVGLSAVFRHGNPLKQALGVVSSIKRFGSKTGSERNGDPNLTPGIAFRQYRLSVLENWSAAAQTLTEGRFDDTVRNIEGVFQGNDRLSGELSAIWINSLNRALDTKAKQLSGFFSQVLFNLPPLGFMAHMAWTTITTYFESRFLGSNFFLHSFLTLALILFFTFFIHQVWVRALSGGDRIARAALKDIKQRSDLFADIPSNPYLEQVDAVLALSGAPVAKQ